MKAADTWKENIEALLTEFFPRANSNALVVLGPVHIAQEVEEVGLSISATMSRKSPVRWYMREGAKSYLGCDTALSYDIMLPG